MRNWKNTVFLHLIKYSIVWAYLWGIESYTGSPPPAGRSRVWAYLWGIESGRTKYNITEYDTFEPTYEELKVKHRKHFRNSSNKFEPTYEELKDEEAKEFFESLFGLSLPMRNWKSFLKSQVNLRLCVWAYLWGIESIWTCKESKVYLRLSLPMRNWK